MNVQAALKQGDISPGLLADAWMWAHKSGIQLAQGDFQLVGRKYQVEPMQSEAPYQCARKSTQGGWTEMYVLRSLHALIHRQYPLGILYLFPSDNDVTDFSASRFKPLISDNPSQIGKYLQDTNRENLKRIHKAHIFFRGARLAQMEKGGLQTSSRLFSIPVDAVIYDEWNFMKAGVRDLARGRMGDSSFKHEFFLGNPGLPETGIDKVYEDESDRRVWMIKCDACGKETCMELEFPNCLQRRKDNTVYRACLRCGREIFPDDGRWVARNPDRDMEGRWNSQIIQPKTDLTAFLNEWEGLEFTQNRTTKTTNFYNLKLGMAYVAAENKLSVNDIYNICTQNAMGSNHYGPCAMGVDVGSMLHVVIGYRPYDSGLAGAKFARVSTFNDVYDLGKKFNVSSCVIDMKPEIRKAREFQDNAPFEVFLCDYQENQRNIPNFDSPSGVVTINRTEVCDATHDLVTIPGRYTVPRRDSEVEQYAYEMSNIAKVLETNDETGERKYFYRIVGGDRPDHYRHATNYFLLAAMRIGVAEPPRAVKKKDRYSMGPAETEGKEIW